MGQTPFVVWFTGLPGAGKSTIAIHVELELHNRGQHTYVLGGDEVRRGLNSDLGYTDADRAENIRRAAELARLMTDAGLVVLASFISPFARDRELARRVVADVAWFEVFVDAPLAMVEARDPKGLYRKARRGELRNVTGIDSPYGRPETPDLRLDMTALTPPLATAEVIAMLERHGLVLPP
jgi:bifunctional enzyme CysN/CysC